MIQDFPVERIARADLDRVEAIQHIELGQRDAVYAAGDHRLTNENGIEPTAAALAPRDGAEFMASLAQLLAGGVFQFGWEGAFAHARGVTFDDAQHSADFARPHARARRRLPC